MCVYTMSYVLQCPRAYRAAVGGERACNPHSANIDGEILIVTKNSKMFDEQTSVGNVCTWFYSDLLPF